VVYVVDTVVGWPEIIFWRDEYLCKNISTTNVDALCNVVFSDKTNATNNLYGLFNLSSIAEDGSYQDPLESSLFNLDTLKSLISAGEAAKNIMVDKDVNFVDEIPNHEFHQISIKLGFCDKDSILDDCDCKQVYMVYLWMETLF